MGVFRLMDIKSLIVVLVIFTFIGLTLPTMADSIMLGNSTLTSDVAYPLLKTSPIILVICGALMFVYWAYQENKE
jgi:hypothetical protein